VMGSIEEALDDGVRALIQMESGGGKGGEEAAAVRSAVKGLLKARRDGVAGVAGAGGVGAGAGGAAAAAGDAGGQVVDPLAQVTQLVCRALLKGAERV
jgi:hypothetical protein